MGVLSRFFLGYVKGNFHVACMVLCFYEITQLRWGFSSFLNDQLLVLCLSFLAYNGIRHYPFVHFKQSFPPYYLALFFIAFFYSGFLFLGRSMEEQLLLFCCFLLSLAYTIPFPRKHKNLRNRYGLKIFIVALCWTLLTAVFPLLGLAVFECAHYLFFVERFIMVVVATLPFEIRDSSADDQDLGTIPQLIGCHFTKLLGYGLLLLLLFLIVFNPAFSLAEASAMGAMLLAYCLSLYFIQPSSPKNSTLFWVEAIPLVGFMIYFFNPF